MIDLKDETARLRAQVTEAEAALDRLTEARQRALDGAGLSPPQKDIDRARARLEAAETLLKTHLRMERT